MHKIKQLLNHYFKVEERQTTIVKEIICGVIVFLAMVYILPVNMQIFSSIGMSSGAIFAATAITSAIATLIMGLVANVPIALSTGMGLNAFVAFTVCTELGYTWQEGLALIFISGIIFFIFSMTGLRVKIVDAIPKDIKIAISSGIGFFIAFVGLKSAGIITSSSSTLVKLGDLSNPTVLLGLFGIILVFILINLKGFVKTFAIIITMVVVAIVGLILGALGIKDMPAFAANASDISDLSQSFGVAFKHFGSVLARSESYAVIFAIVFVNLFDTTATIVAIGEKTGIINQEGKLINGKKVMLADATGSIVGGLLGTSTVTPFAESTIGVESGARTGLSSVVTALLFLLSLVIYPFFSVFSSVGEAGLTPVTSMALVLIGAVMFKNIKDINWHDQIVTFTAFMILILMILTYSISDGIGIGIIIYVLMMLISKRGKEVSPIMYIVAFFFIVNFILHYAVLI
jgi:AGZA family xanthine/uracil permease-like MFS transporter